MTSADGRPTSAHGATGGARPGVDGVDGALTTLTAAVDDLLGVPLWRCGDEEVRTLVVALEAQAARLDAARLRVLAAAHERSVGTALGAPSTWDWLVAATSTRAEHARRRVELAVALDGPLAATGRALAEGAVTADQAGVLHVTTTRLPPAVDATTRADAEAFLLEQARSDGAAMDPRSLARVGRHLVASLDPGLDDDLARAETRQQRQRQLRCTQADDGAWLLSGALDGVGGATLVAALQPLAAPRPGTDGTPDPRSHPHRMADALVAVAEAHLAGATGTASARPRLVVTVPAATLAAPGAPGAEPGHLPGGAPVSRLTTSVLACDAEVLPVLVGPDGAPLDVGRTVYAFPPRVRAAIHHRDRTCTFVTPGNRAGRRSGRGGRCTRPAEWGHVHHLVPWSRGGSTSERNGVALCGHHHRWVHAHGWRGELVGTEVRWHPPDVADDGRGGPPVSAPPPWWPALRQLTERWVARTYPPSPAEEGDDGEDRENRAVDERGHPGGDGDVPDAA